MNDAKSSGALGYIVKPFDKDKVIEEIKRVLG
jgi:AmiR/NasT family two-component response regulator